MLSHFHKSNTRNFDGLSFQIRHHFDKLKQALKKLQGVIIHHDLENHLEIPVNLKQESIEYILSHISLTLAGINAAINNVNIHLLTSEVAEYFKEIMEITVYFQKTMSTLLEFDFEKTIDNHKIS